MKLCSACLTVALVTTAWCSAIPTEQQKKRVHDEKPLSDLPHDVDGEHNSEYDHDAFLGQEAEMFDNLTPEESKERLGILVDKIDKDHDGFVTKEELKSWIQYVQKRYITTETDKVWGSHEPDGNVLTWQAYKKKTYGGDEDFDGGDYVDMVTRDKRRWDTADKDKDGHLSKEEFQDFLHPEEADHMKDIVVDETIADIDKDGDGLISLEEYIADIVDEEDDEDEDDEDSDERDDNREWVEAEKDQFRYHRDLNNDGKLDREEVRGWVMPENYDHSEAEATHLVTNSDVNKDDKLSREEILDKYDLFVGSQATEFGEALMRHDEF